jgi:hypothetical protein
MMTKRQVSALFDKVSATRAAGRDPIVVLDLDGTLYNNQHRTLRILQEFAHAHGAENPGLVAAVDSLSPDQVRYAMTDTLGAAGLAEPEVLAAARQYWLDRFFTDAYLGYDLPTPGAVAFVHLIHKAGGVPAYLTGRDAPNMLIGTVRALQRDGFPVGTVGTRIILKEDFPTPDYEYKARVIKSLRRMGDVVGAFDNEPGLCNLFQEAYPEASVFWLDAPHAPDPPLLDDRVEVIADFTTLLM